ncbi:MAG: DMT family transporter, partial [Parcubacteria group bacterium]
MTLLFIGLMFCGTFALGLSDVFRKKYLNEGLDDQVFLTITLFLTGILLLPVVIFLGIPDIKDGFWSAFVVTMLLNLISQNLFIKAFKMSEASLIAPLRLIIPLFVVITGFLFLGEKPSFMGVVGIVITMFGLWFLLSDGRNKYQNFLLIIKDRGVISV